MRWWRWWMWYAVVGLAMAGKYQGWTYAYGSDEANVRFVVVVLMWGTILACGTAIVKRVRRKREE